jgi:hypothetical protein
MAALQRAFEATVFALEQALVRQAELDKEIATAASSTFHRPSGLKSGRSADAQRDRAYEWTHRRGVSRLSGTGLPIRRKETPRDCSGVAQDTPQRLRGGSVVGFIPLFLKPGVSRKWVFMNRN